MTQAGQDWARVLEHAQAVGQSGVLEASIGFDCIESMRVISDDEEELREILEARLHEVSLVVEGADRQTTVSMEAASLANVLRGRLPITERERESFEREREASRRRLEVAQRRMGRTGGGWSCVR
jgi:hypothetical protein